MKVDRILQCVLSYVQLVLNFVKQSKGFFGMQFDMTLIFV